MLMMFETLTSSLFLNCCGEYATKKYFMASPDCKIGLTTLEWPDQMQYGIIRSSDACSDLLSESLG